MDNDEGCKYLNAAGYRLRFSLYIEPSLVPPDDGNLTPLLIGYSLVFVFFEKCWVMVDSIILVFFSVSCYTFNRIIKDYVNYIKAKTNVRIDEVKPLTDALYSSV